MAMRTEPGSSSAFKGAKVKSASGAESSKYTVEDLLSKVSPKYFLSPWIILHVEILKFVSLTI